MSLATELAGGLRMFSPHERTRVIKVTVPSGGYTAGQIYKFGDVIGVAYMDYAQGATGVLIVEADDIEVTCVAASGTDFAVGEAVFFDVADAEANQSASGNTFCGHVLRQPAAAAEKVRIRLLGSVDQGNTGITKGGAYTVIAGDDTANTKTIATGLGSISAVNVMILRAGKVVASDPAVSTSAGNLVVADGSTYVLTTNDVIHWIAVGS